MKKKVFSKLLMGALLVASVSSFTSCKDYDDDINDLRSRIDGLNTSLNTTVTNKIATVESSIDLLSKQLAEVKADYAKADEALKTALQTSINAAADKASAAADKATVNASDIVNLQKEVVNLKAVDGNLQDAINKLQEALKEANATLKTQGETLIGLAATDQALETGINEAKAQAANALSEAQKAQTAAATNAANLKSTDATLAALQNTVAENLKAVNNKIDSEIAKLDTRVKTNETNIAKLQEASAKAEANLTTINTKLTELAAKDNEISTAVSEGLTKLAASLGTSVEELKNLINSNKSELISKIGEETAARVEAINALSNRVTANEVAIKNIQEETIPNLIKNLREHLVPEYVEKEVAKQLPAALEVFMNDEVMPYVEDIVATETGKNKSLIDALTAKVKQDSTDLAAFTDAQFLLTAGLLAGKYELDDEASADALAAKELADAIAAADDVLQNNIDDVADALDAEKNPDVAGSLAALIAQIKNDADETSIAGKLKALTNGFNAAIDETNPASLAGRFKTIEDFFAPAADDAEAADISVANLAAKIAETESFTEAVNKAAADANGEILDMITSINLFANQHMAQADEQGKVEKYVYNRKTETGEYFYPAGYDNFDHVLTFVSVIESGQFDTEGTLVKSPWSFPKDYVEDATNPNAYNYKYAGIETGEEDADYYEFIDGRYRNYDDSILVRVSPTNADLRKATLALLNSQGEDIIDLGLVEVTDVQKYTREAGEYLTRGAETGLWVIKFKLKEENIGELWSKYSTAKTGGDILYAVAVKNTGVTVNEETNEVENEEGSVDRYVVSEYDLTLAQEWANNSYDFLVNTVNINKIHNRYIETEQGDGGTTIWTDDPDRNSFRYELTWYNLCSDDWKAIREKAKSEQSESTDEKSNLWIKYYLCCNDCDWGRQDDCDENVYHTAWSKVYFNEAKNEMYKAGEEPCGINAVDRAGHSFTDQGVRETSGEDNRHLMDFLPIEFTEDQAPEGEEGAWAKIEIEFPAFNACGEMTPIKGFFVTLDQKFALESNNSEINSWVSYIYKNVSYFSTNHGQKDGRYDEPIVLQKGNKGVIYIKDANNIYDKDVIGFRVHAVNLDGTLTDPDGRAFYVQVGKTISEHNLSFHITASTRSSYAVQDLVNGKNPIKAFNDERKAEGDDTRFFIRDAYTGSFNPEDEYEVVYEWREGNPAIRAFDNQTRALFPVAGTTNTGLDKMTGNTFTSIPVTTFFSFAYSENPDATIEAKTGDVNNEWTAYNRHYDNRQKVAANRLTQSVRACINRTVADNLIDGATYKIKMIVKRNDSKTGSRVVNVYNIDITKVMPTAMPEKFHVKSYQLEGGKWTFYLRPVKSLNNYKQPATGTSVVSPWNITWGGFAANWIKKSSFAAGFNGDVSMAGNTPANLGDNAGFHYYRWGVDVRPYNFDEVFYGLYEYEEEEEDEPGTGTEETDDFDKNFYFVFKGAGDFYAADAKKSPNDTWAKADNAFKDADAISVFDTHYNYDSDDDINPGEDDDALLKERGVYYLPAIHWSHIGQEVDVYAGYIYRNISANLASNGKEFLPADEEKSTNIGQNIANRDYILPAEQVFVDEAKTTPVKAKFLCAFDQAIKNVNCNGIANEKEIANEFDYNSDPLVVADSAQFNIYSSQWQTGDNRKFFDAHLPNEAEWKLAKGKGPAATDAIKDQDPWNEANVLRALVANDDVSFKLRDLIKGENLWIDEASLQVIPVSPADFVFSDYYYAPYWEFDDNSASFIGMKRKGTSQGLGSLNKDITGKFTFDVLNIWGHRRTITVTFKIKKPSTATGARATR